MSTIKLKNIQLGDNPDPSKNFVLSVPAVADGTLSIKRQDGTNVLSIDATGKAVIPGVVGTVAQVGGIPTGQVVERGSNANGEYVRFADGTQICTQRVGTHQNTRTVWTFPASFINSDVIQCPFIGEVNTDGTNVTVTIRVRAASSVNYQTTGPNNAHAVQRTAIGRWF